MGARVVQCPNCGGSVEFKAGSSLLSVCEFCSSVVARLGDDIGELEILGKVAPLADLASPLSIGAMGQWESRAFSIVGQVQYDFGAGVWNEWYISFVDGQWGWLAEAQGRVYLTTNQSLDGVPVASELAVGQKFSLNSEGLRLVERRSATFVTAQGEVPFRATPGETFDYGDVEGARGRFGTIDYGPDGRPTAFFLGYQLAYKDLFAADVLNEAAPTQIELAAGLNCPNCGAAVHLRAPDEAQRITCLSCDSLLDCTKGSELYLLSSYKGWIPEGQLELGATGTIERLFSSQAQSEDNQSPPWTLTSTQWTVYGLVAKAIREDGVVYRWHEYLVRGEDGEWAWLVESYGHWSFVAEVSGGAVQYSSAYNDNVDVEGLGRFMPFSRASVRVEGLRGEFYWKVSVGDRVSATDFTNAPYLLTEEQSAEEIHYSVGCYLAKEEVETGFKLKNSLPPPEGIAPHQPNPYQKLSKNALRLSAWLSLILGLVVLGRCGAADEKPVATHQMAFQAAGTSLTGRSIPGVPSQPITFTVDEYSNLAIEADGVLGSGSIYLDAVLSDLSTQQVRRFGILVDGVRDRSRGRAKRTVYIGELYSGNYELRLTPTWYGTQTQRPSALTIKVVSDIYMQSHAVVAFLLMWIYPLIVLLAMVGFEWRRWSESDLSE